MPLLEVLRSGVAVVASDISVAGVEADEGVDDRVGIDAGTAEREDAARQVVVEAIERRARRYSPPNFTGVAALDPREIVEDLVGLAGASARDAEAGCAEVFDHTAEVELGQPELPLPTFRPMLAGIEGAVEGVECRLVRRPAETDLVDLRGAQGREQANRNDLHAGRRDLGELRQARSGAESAKTSEREDLRSAVVSIAPGELFVLDRSSGRS